MNATMPGAPKSSSAAANDTWSERVRTIGGLVAVVVGVAVVGVIAIVAVVKNTSTASTIASSTAGVIATIVGAYFGMKIGSDQSKDANKSQKAEAAKAQVFAAHVPPEAAAGVLALADEAAEKAVTEQTGS